MSETATVEQWDRRDIAAGIIVLACALTALAGAVLLQGRSDGLTFACIITSLGMAAWRLW